MTKFPNIACPCGCPSTLPQHKLDVVRADATSRWDRLLALAGRNAHTAKVIAAKAARA